jgi:hypothetical protein
MTDQRTEVITLRRSTVVRIGIALLVLAALGVGLAVGLSLGSASPPSAKTAATSTSRPLAGTTSTTVGTTSTTAAPTTTSTNPLREVLAPATIPPVVNECAAGSVTVTTSADGNVSPLLGPNGCIVVAAWQWYASDYPQVLGAGPSVTETQMISTMCGITNRTIPTVENASKLAAAYYGWAFAS